MASVDCFLAKAVQSAQNDMLMMNVLDRMERINLKLLPVIILNDLFTFVIWEFI
jgi:hypothetical protein